LPCEFTQLQLLLADLSGNEWHASPLPGELGCEGHSFVTPATAAHGSRNRKPAAAAVEGDVSGKDWAAETESQQQQRQYVFSSSSSNRLTSRQLGQHLVTAATGGALTAPRCWLRRFCYDEGAFICLQRRGKAAAAGGCSSYVYGASDLHIDPLNQCDHGGSHLAAITVMFTAFGTALLLIWLHHCR
jgi:hypothetical protein